MRPLESWKTSSEGKYCRLGHQMNDLDIGNSNMNGPKPWSIGQTGDQSSPSLSSSLNWWETICSPGHNEKWWRPKKKITEETAITTIFGHLEELYLDVKPHWVQRMDFFRSNQGSHEKFKSDEPAKRLWMKTASRDGMNSDEIDVLELIRGAHSDKLRKEMLIEKDPRPIS